MPKVDGIKKMSREELLKSRKAILEIINEPADELMLTPKKIDGINSFNSIKKASKETGFEKIDKYDKNENAPEKTKTIDSEQRKKWKGLISNIISDEEKKLEPIEQKLSNDSVIKKESEAKLKNREVEEMKKEEAQRIKREEEERIKFQKEKEQRTREKEENRRVEIEKKKTEENRRKKDRDEKLKKEEKLAKKRQKEQTRKNRKKKMTELKNKINLKISFYFLNSKIVLKKLLNLTAYAIMGAIVMYSLFAIMLLRFEADNAILRKVADYVMVPAIITSDGVVEYYNYKDIKDEIQNNAGYLFDSSKEAKVEIIKNIILNNLKRKYGLDESENISDAEFHNYIINDYEINQVPISRIEKIKEMIDENSDFIRISTKYGDDLGMITLKTTEEKIEKEELYNLNMGEVSGIIIKDDGYYIYRCFNKNDELSELSYVYIRPKTLNSYLNEKVEGYEMWSLVD